MKIIHNAALFCIGAVAMCIGSIALYAFSSRDTLEKAQFHLDCTSYYAAAINFYRESGEVQEDFIKPYEKDAMKHFGKASDYFGHTNTIILGKELMQRYKSGMDKTEKGIDYIVNKDIQCHKAMR